MAYFERLENPRYELIDGEERMLAQPSMNHARIARNLMFIIQGYLKGKRCEVFGEVDVYFDESNHYVPDIVVVCDRDKMKFDGVYGAPDLVVEILSPSTGKRDVGIKKEAYERFGVREYWIVNPKEKSIEAYHLRDGKFVLDDRYTVLEDYEERMLNEKEKAEHRLTLKVSLYDDLEIDVREVFEDMT
jgi:Uma2 family endonuclease